MKTSAPKLREGMQGQLIHADSARLYELEESKDAGPKLPLAEAA